MHNIVDSEKICRLILDVKVVNIVKIGYCKTCGFVKSLGILQDLSTDIKQKINKTAEVVCFGVKNLTSIIHGLLFQGGW